MDKQCLPSMGWMGSIFSATFLSSNSASSSNLGCGAVELVHPLGGMVYRYLKCLSLRRIIEGRAGLSNFIRVMRAAFIAATLEDKGETQVKLPKDLPPSKKVENDEMEAVKEKPPFILCVDELIKKGGLSHGSFVRSLRIISGPIREPYLRGSLVDVDKSVFNPILSQPEAFPNSYVRGASGLYLRVGTCVEPATTADQQGSSVVKGNHLQLHVVTEPVIAFGGIAFGGPVTLRVIENGGQCQESIKTIETDGNRSEWKCFFHAEPVTTAKRQAAASGNIETSSVSRKNNKSREEDRQDTSTSLLGASASRGDSVFDENQLHRGGYQALELVRLTNRTPLLWIRLDPHGLYNGRFSVFLQDACLGEQLFHDGDASSQVEALRALAERPLRVQGTSDSWQIAFVDQLPFMQIYHITLRSVYRRP